MNEKSENSLRTTLSDPPSLVVGLEYTKAILKLHGMEPPKDLDSLSTIKVPSIMVIPLMYDTGLPFEKGPSWLVVRLPLQSHFTLEVETPLPEEYEWARLGHPIAPRKLWLSLDPRGKQ